MSDIQENSAVLEKDPNINYIILKGSTETPEVLLDRDNGKIKFSGRSLPEDAKSFYKPIKGWLNNYIENPPDETHAVFAYEYFNTASSKMILEMLDILKLLEEKGGKIKIDWYYLEDDDDMLEAGEDFAEIADLKFDYISYE